MSTSKIPAALAAADTFLTARREAIRGWDTAHALAIAWNSPASEAAAAAALLKLRCPSAGKGSALVTAATMTLGGPLAIACPLKTCRQAVGLHCRTDEKRAMRAGDCSVSREPHAARVKAAPPVEEVGAGDLVLVQLTPGRGAKHLLALLVELGETPLVRLWRGGPGAFASPRRVVRSALLRRAPEDDPRVEKARAFLEELVPVRARVFDTKAHGRIWIVDVFDLGLAWKAVDSETRGHITREEWRRLALAGEVVVPTVPLASAPTASAIPPIPAAVPRTAPKGW